MRKYDYHVSVEADESKSKWFAYKRSAVKYAIKMSETVGYTYLYEYEIDENGHYIMISKSAV